MKNALLIGSLVIASILSAPQASASIMGDTVTGSQTGLGAFNGGDVVIIDDLVSSEFTGTQTVVGDTTVNFALRFNFYFDTLDNTNHLFFHADYASSGNETYQMGDFTVTFLGLNDVDFPAHTILGVTPTYDSFTLSEGQGLGITTSGNDLVLTFDDFLVPEEARDFDLLIEFSDSISTPVVPVPAAAPMVLIGMGVVALARRIRRSKS